MKTTLKTLTIIFCLCSFWGCSKNGDTPLSKEEQVVKFLTGDGNRYWHIKEVYQNNLMQPLTNDQLKYTKTYTLVPGQTRKGTWTNSDGDKGIWSLDTFESIYQESSNNPVGPATLTYRINEINENKLDVYYIANSVKTREVYYAF